MGKSGYTSTEAMGIIKMLEKKFSAPYGIIGWSEIGEDEKGKFETDISASHSLHHTLKELYFSFRMKKKGNYSAYKNR